jgi:hypothetical protein
MQHHPERQNKAEAGKRRQVILLDSSGSDGMQGLAGYTLTFSGPCTRHEFWRLDWGRNTSLYYSPAPGLRTGLATWPVAARSVGCASIRTVMGKPRDCVTTKPLRFRMILIPKM